MAKWTNIIRLQWSRITKVPSSQQISTCKMPTNIITMRNRTRSNIIRMQINITVMLSRGHKTILEMHNRLHKKIWNLQISNIIMLISRLKTICKERVSYTVELVNKPMIKSVEVWSEMHHRF